MNHPSSSCPSHAIRLERPLEGRILGGVAAGLAKFLDVEVLIVRAVFVALCFLSGLGVALYLGAWAVLAETGSKNTVPGEIVMRSWYR